MAKIITLTVNPAIDKSTAVNGIRPEKKLRCNSPVFEAGGGGINISRVIRELGGNSLCTYFSGGPAGTRLQEMLSQLNIMQQVFMIQGWTRENLAVTDTLTNEQYRFGMPGPVVVEDEWESSLQQIEALLETEDILVASGSLSPGMPLDFFAKLSNIAQTKQVKFVLDTSGEPLLHGVRAGAYLLKPNLGEFASLCGLKNISFGELRDIAQVFLNNNPCQVLVVSLGPRGAMIFDNQGSSYHIPSPVVPKVSTIGAGDSMVAGMVFALANGKSHLEMAQYGVACGTAATMTAGTQLCKRKDAEELYQWITTSKNQTQG